jgi:hypothetical protein
MFMCISICMCVGVFVFCSLARLGLRIPYTSTVVHMYVCVCMFVSFSFTAPGIRIPYSEPVHACTDVYVGMYVCVYICVCLVFS